MRCTRVCRNCSIGRIGDANIAPNRTSCPGFVSAPTAERGIDRDSDAAQYPLVEAVLFGESGLRDGLSEDTLVVDMSSVPPLATKRSVAALDYKCTRASRDVTTV
jgi:hypothetical protein